MTIGAPGEKGTLEIAVDHGGMMAVQMPGVALHTQERLGYGQELVIGRSVGIVTIGAILGQIGMLIDKRPLEFHVAPGAHLLHGRLLEAVILS